VMEFRALSVTTSLLAVLLLFQAAVYLSAPWASLATEGILITPLRRIYLRSSQNSAASAVETRSSAAILPVGLALAATAFLIVAFAATSPTASAPFGGGPSTPAQVGPNLPALLTSPSPSASPSPSPSASSSPSPSPSASPIQSASASPTASPTPTPTLSPAPSPSATP